MHAHTVAGVMACAVALTACTADAPAATRGPLGPEVVASEDSPSGYEVTFRFADDDAEQVWLAGDLYFAAAEDLALEGARESWLGDAWQPGDVSTLPLAADLAPMTRTRDGIWELTTAIPAGLWNYGFVTSECSLILMCTVAEDPANTPALATDPAATQRWSSLAIAVDPGHPTYAADHQVPLVQGDAAAGTLTRVANPDLGVYLPAEYDPTRAEPYPLLILSHGAGDDETAWWTQGGAAAQLDHAIAEGSIPAVVAITTDFTHLSEPGMEDPEFFELYASHIVDDVLPYAESTLNATADPADRAFAGLSMGGRLAEHLMLTRSALFDAYGMWSMPAEVHHTDAADLTDAHLVTATTASAVHLGTGAQDALTLLPSTYADLASAYAHAGMTATTLTVDGGHSWWVWRQMLADFLETTAFGR